MLLLRGEVLFCCCCIFVGCCRVCNFAVAALLLVLFVFAVGPRGECICDALCCGGAFFFFCCWCKGCFFLLCCGGGGGLYGAQHSDSRACGMFRLRTHGGQGLLVTLSAHCEQRLG